MALLVPAILFLVAAWKSRIDALREGESEIARSLVEMRDHVQAVLKIEELTLARIDDHIRNLTWMEIAEPKTALFLREVASQMSGQSLVWIANSEGLIQASSKTWEPGARVVEQQFFGDDRQRDSGTYLSIIFAGAPPRIASIDMVRRRSTMNGSFDGTIHCALSSEYLIYIFSVAAPVSHDALLVRGDGEIMSREPKTPDMHMNIDSPLMQHITAQVGDHIFTDQERLYSVPADSRIPRVP